MKRLKGPELKLGRPQVPAFLIDLYYDLRDRRLLPLVALVLVAIVAAPLLLGDDAEETLERSPDSSPIAALKETAAETSALTVVEAKPGLRDYHKRLHARTPTDPFKQRYAGAVLKGSELNEPKSPSTTQSSSGDGENASTSPATTEVAPPPSDSSGGAPAGNGGDGGGSGADSQPGSKAVVYSFGVDLKIVHSSGSEAAGDRQTGEPDIRKRVLPPTTLPSRETEVVTYLGLSPKTRKPLFLVSTDVTGVFGEGKCAAGSDRCQLIELEPGMPQIFEYGESGDRYKITVTDIESVVTGKL